MYCPKVEKSLLAVSTNSAKFDDIQKMIKRTINYLTLNENKYDSLTYQNFYSPSKTYIPTEKPHCNGYTYMSKSIGLNCQYPSIIFRNIELGVDCCLFHRSKNNFQKVVWLMRSECL